VIGDLEKLLRQIVRDELARILGVEPDDIDTSDEDELRARAAERAAQMRAARGGGK